MVVDKDLGAIKESLKKVSEMEKLLYYVKKGNYGRDFLYKEAISEFMGLATECFKLIIEERLRNEDR